MFYPIMFTFWRSMSKVGIASKSGRYHKLLGFYRMSVT